MTTHLTRSPATGRSDRVAVAVARARSVVGILGIWVGLVGSVAAQQADSIGYHPPLIDTSHYDGAYTYHKQTEPEDWLVRVGTDWMRYIPDGTPLSWISIPGTHDSGAVWAYASKHTRAQSWSITDQLRAGIRYLDVRFQSWGDGTLHVTHNSDQGLTLDQLLNEVRKFLRENPTETLLMRAKEDGRPYADADWEWLYRHKNPRDKDPENIRKGAITLKLATNPKEKHPLFVMWNLYMDRYADLFPANSLYGNAGVSVNTPIEKMRGKVLLLRDMGEDHMSDNVGIRFNNSSIDYQGRYDCVEYDAHVARIKMYIAKARENGLSRSGNMVLNNMAATCWSAGIYYYASVTNPKISDYIDDLTEPTGYLGVLIMDFPGDKLIHQIIRSNFAPVRYDQQCVSQIPPRTVSRPDFTYYLRALQVCRLTESTDSLARSAGGGVTIEKTLSGASSLCVDVREDQDRGRMGVGICDYSSKKPYQYWKYIDGQFRNEASSNRCMDVSENKEGGTVVFHRCGSRTTNPFQFWTVQKMSDEASVIVNDKSQTVLTSDPDRTLRIRYLMQSNGKGLRPSALWRTAAE